MKRVSRRGAPIAIGLKKSSFLSAQLGFLLINSFVIGDLIARAY
jgi:hypothetical protein